MIVDADGLDGICTDDVVEEIRELPPVRPWLRRAGAGVLLLLSVILMWLAYPREQAASFAFGEETFPAAAPVVPPLRTIPADAMPAEMELPARFARNSRAPIEVDEAALAETVRVLQACQGAIVVTGHTCSLGEPGLNRELGLGRAAAARALLAAQGIAPSRVAIESAGASAPRTRNDSLDGRRANRRVTLHCFKGDGT